MGRYLVLRWNDTRADGVEGNEEFRLGIVRDLDLLLLLPLTHSLTSLELGSEGWDRPTLSGLSVVRQLTNLVHLKLVDLRALREPELHASLLPLPPMLRRLELHGSPYVRLNLGARVQLCCKLPTRRTAP